MTTRADKAPTPRVAAFPVRSLWAWPLGCALIGVVETVIQSGRIGGGVGGLVLAWFFAAAAGVWPGVLFALVGVLLHRRGFSWPDRLVRFFGDLSTPLVFGLVVAFVGWRGVAIVHGVFETRRFDFVEDSVDVWRAAVVVAVPIGVLALYVIMRRVEDRFSKHRWWPLIGKLALGACVVWMSWHLCGGPFVTHFGAAVPLGLVVLSAIAVAVWLPASVEGRRGQVVTLAPLVLVVGLGYVGSEHIVARALLLHDTRVFPVVHATAFAFTDRDADGETGTWAGGPDCNDDDPLIASWRPEMPGNGIDDNCRLGDGTAPPAANPPGERMPGKHVPVFLITLDTVRADRLDLLDHERDTMPYLNDYAETAAWFRRAYSPSNHTGFSIISILSGQGPEFLISDPKVFTAHGKKFTHWLPHTLAKLGYETWAINPTLVGTNISREQLRFENYYMGPFDHAPKNRGTRAKQIADWTRRFVSEHQADKPLFAWIHIADAHAKHMGHQHFPGSTTEDAYDNELRWIDLNLAGILDAIHTRYGNEVIVAITSDHGEEFGERGAYGHGFALREGILNVPLLISGPGVKAGPVERPVNVGGISASIVRLIGEPVSERITVPDPLEESEAPVVAGAPFFWSEQRMEVALIESRYKLVNNRSAGTFLLFDLENDPAESQNLAGSDPAQLERMQARMAEALEQLR